MAGIEFDALTLDHIGANADDGVNLKDELNAHIKEVAAKVVDDRFGEAGTVTLKISLSKAADNMVAVSGSCTAKLPTRTQKAAVGYVSEEGEVLVQRATQQNLPLEAADVINLANQANPKEQS